MAWQDLVGWGVQTPVSSLQDDHIHKKMITRSMQADTKTH